MNKIIYTVGIQGSGKSFWAKEFCQKNKDWVRVCRDDLRNMRGQYWIPKQEDLITIMEFECIKAALSKGHGVVIDAMNLNHDRIMYRMSELQKYFPELSWKKEDFTDVSLEECIKNDLKRPNSIGEKVIRETYNKYLNKQQVYRENPELSKAIIVDIDGTLAIKGKRSPFDWHLVGEDACNVHIAEIVRRYFNTHTVLIFSGRDSICRPQTEKWLQDNIIPYSALYMRPEGSMEKDTIVKQRMFEEQVKGKYLVDFVLDDRNQVVDLWRAMGLNCLQVAEGDF